MAGWVGAQYFLFCTGIVASNICDGGGFLYADETLLHQMCIPGSDSEYGLKVIKNGVTLNSAFLRSRSRGSVKLKSIDPFNQPIIDPNYWADAYDVEYSIKAFKLTRQIMQQDAFKPFIKAEFSPSAECQTDDDIKQIFKN